MSSKKSIFIVEDEAIVAADLGETLESLGYKLAGTAKTGEIALEKIAQTNPDLVLMDIHLAGSMDGIETAEKIHSALHIPVIYLTAHANDQILERAEITEPYGYIIKPYDERGLQSTIKMALYKHRIEQKTKENERTIRILANAIPDAVMLLDHNQDIIALNDAMVRRSGYNYDQIHADSPVRFNQNGRFTSLESQIGEILRSGRPVRFEEENQDGCFEISLILIAGPEGQNSRIFVQYHDITDRKRLEEALKKEGITQIEQNMEQFQILNDQIRNPLQAIMGFVNLDCAQYRDRIMEQIKLVDTLVDRLDRGWLESEKVRSFLLRHYQGDPAVTAEPVACEKPGEDQ